MDHSSVHDSGDNTPSFFVQFESNSLKKKIIQSGNEHISICTMQFEFTRPQHKQIKKKNISVGNEILSLSSVARQLSELRIAEALKISLKKVWLESTFAPVSSYLHTTKKMVIVEEATLRFVHHEKFSARCVSFTIHTNLCHSILFWFAFSLLLPLSCSSTWTNFYFLGFLVLKGNSLTHQLAVNDKAVTRALASLPWVRWDFYETERVEHGWVFPVFRS